jgi:hypothetical protein
MNRHSTSHYHDVVITKGGESLAEFDVIIDGIVIEEAYWKSVAIFGAYETLDDGDVQRIIFGIKCDLERDPNSMIQSSVCS